ncbi:sulfurtransferase, partial [Geminicoccus harenae]
GQKLESGEVRLPARRFVARFRPELVLDLDRVRAVLEDGSTQVVDVRSPGRFRGAEPEPRAGLRSGHMPGAVNLPYGELIDTDGRLLPNDRLQMALEGAGIDLRLPVAASCGSGVSAAVLALAAYQLGKEDLAVYDGSWTEWGGRKDTPIVTE